MLLLVVCGWVRLYLALKRGDEAYGFAACMQGLASILPHYSSLFTTSLSPLSSRSHRSLHTWNETRRRLNPAHSSDINFPNETARPSFHSGSAIAATKPGPKSIHLISNSKLGLSGCHSCQEAAAETATVWSTFR